MNLEKVIEYAIYHDNLDKKISLPGIKRGLPEESFFLKKKNFLNTNQFENLTSEIIYKQIKKINDINVLCSGGVDSSILIHYLKKYNKKFMAIHNFYPKHKQNDLNKMKSLKKFYTFKSKNISISSTNYLKGMELSFKNRYFGNVYAPTVFYSLNNINNNNKFLMTGSGPDELFYGMEKYSLNFFKKLNHLETYKALEILDTNYNDEFYKKILNKDGLDIYNIVKIKRLEFYKKISEINNNLLEAQRILSYCTVSNQHFEMFEKISNNFDMKHVCPFLDKTFIKFAFSFDLKNFLDLKKKLRVKDAYVGKKQLKMILAKFTSSKHAYDIKIGFHAPMSKLINQKINLTNVHQKLNYDILSRIIDIDKLKTELKKQLTKNDKNYCLFSLIGTQNYLNYF